MQRPAEVGPIPLLREQIQSYPYPGDWVSCPGMQFSPPLVTGLVLIAEKGVNPAV